MPQPIEIAILSDRHFWRGGYDKALQAIQPRPASAYGHVWAITQDHPGSPGAWRCGFFSQRS
jgi:hypothetical protein